jgi:hypothetical protein
MQTTEDPELGLLHEAYCFPAFQSRKVRHAELWELLGSLVDEAGNLSRDEIGRSAEGRPLYAVRFGRGATRVLLWSQMHGDEPSHTLGLADFFAYVAREPDDERVRILAERLTVVAVPMLNPDGAERFLRTNAQGVDINRDARAWTTPELRALRDLHASFRPEFALNLHDQDVRKRVGKSERLTAFALLATPGGPEMEDDEQRMRGKRLCAAIVRAVRPLVGDRVARFPDEYHPDGSGEHTQRAGSVSVLLECGFWPDDLEKQFLRKVSFVSLLGAFEALAGGSLDEAPDAYESLEENDTKVFDTLVRGGTVVVPGLEPFRADVAADFAAPLDLRDGTTSAIGDLADYTARVVVDAAGLFVHPEPEALGEEGGLREGRPASFTVRRGVEPESEVVSVIRGGVVRGDEDDG